jgi:hypothetical protein
LTPETRVFRVFPVSRLEEVFQSGRITLVRPRKWEDPCENQFYNITVVDSAAGATVSVESMRSCLYGQSWTLTEESDVLWRIYSDDKRGIRVATTRDMHHRNTLKLIPPPSTAHQQYHSGLHNE